jgi:hypothetical protein
MVGDDTCSNHEHNLNTVHSTFNQKHQLYNYFVVRSRRRSIRKEKKINFEHQIWWSHSFRWWIDSRYVHYEIKDTIKTFFTITWTGVTFYNPMISHEWGKG